MLGEMTGFTPARLPPVVTIAALYGAGGSRIASRVAERLAVPFLDRATPATVAGRTGLLEQALDELDERPRGRAQRLLAGLGRSAPPTGASGQVERLDLEHRRLHAEIEAFLAGASRCGGVVLGRGGAIVLADVPGALHVYLGGDRTARVARVMAGKGVDRETAAHLVKVNDHARRDYVRSAYGVEGDDPALYHLMVDAIAFGVDACVDLVVAASESRAGRADGDRTNVRRGDAQAP
jgi:cytidylate kinase